MPKISLSPTLFIILEFFILLPSVLFLTGLIIWILFQNSFLYLLIVNGNLLQICGVLFVSPFSGGVLAYGYLERFKAHGRSARLARVLLGYSIIIMGLVFVYFMSTLFS